MNEADRNHVVDAIKARMCEVLDSYIVAGVTISENNENPEIVIAISVQGREHANQLDFVIADIIRRGGVIKLIRQ